MSKLNNPEFHFLMHLVNSCIHFQKTYIKQSRLTQIRLIFKAFGELIPLSTFDKTIRRLKDGWGLWKQHRSGSVSGHGYSWKTSLTFLPWALVRKMRKKGMLTNGHMIQLREIFDGMKKRGPAELRATPAAQDVKTGKEKHEGFLFPT